jgi:hypothetical protein
MDVYQQNPRNMSDEEKQMFDELVYEEMKRMEEELRLEDDEMNNNNITHEDYKDYNSQPMKGQKEVSVLNPLAPTIYHMGMELKEGRNVSYHDYKVVKNNNNNNNNNDITIKVPSQQQQNNNKWKPPLDEETLKKKMQQREYHQLLQDDKRKQDIIIQELQKTDHLAMPRGTIKPVPPPPSVSEYNNNNNENDDIFLIGKDPKLVIDEKRMKQLTYARQLAEQQQQNQQFSSNSQIPSTHDNHTSINYNQHSSSNENDLKKIRQRQYYEDLSAQQAASPLPSERISLRSIRKDSVGGNSNNNIYDVNYDNNQSTSLPIGDYQYRKENRELKKESQLLYKKQLEECSKLPVLSQEKLIYSSRFDVAKARKDIIDTVDKNYEKTVNNNSGGGVRIPSASSALTYEQEELRRKRIAQQEYAQQIQEASKPTKVSPRVSLIQQKGNKYNNIEDSLTSIQIGNDFNRERKLKEQQEYARLLQLDQRNISDNSSNTNRNTSIDNNNYSVTHEQEQRMQQEQYDALKAAEDEVLYRQMVMQTARREFERKKQEEYYNALNNDAQKSSNEPSYLTRDPEYEYQGGYANKAGKNRYEDSNSSESRGYDEYIKNTTNELNILKKKEQDLINSYIATSHQQPSPAVRTDFRTRGLSQGGGPTSISIFGGGSNYSAKNNNNNELEKEVHQRMHRQGHRDEYADALREQIREKDKYSNLKSPREHYSDVIEDAKGGGQVRGFNYYTGGTTDRYYR